MNRKRFIWPVASVLATVGLVTSVVPVAGADESDESDANQCAAMHMVLANGTGDSNSNNDPNRDQGFFSKLARGVVDEAATVDRIDDRAGGLADSLSDFSSSSSSGFGGDTSTTDGDQTDEDRGDEGSSFKDQVRKFLDEKDSDTASDESDEDDQADTESDADTDTSDDEQDSTSDEEVDNDDADDEDSQLEVTRTFVTYPASAGGAQFVQSQRSLGPSVSYTESMEKGVKSATEQISAVHDQCPDTKLFLVGYSQGAEVIDKVARQIGAGDGPVDADQVAGVSLLASPTRNAATPLSVSGTDQVAGNLSGDATKGLLDYDTPDGGGISPDMSGHSDYGQLADRTVSWCLQGDLVCGLPVDSEAARAVIGTLEGVDVTDPQKSLSQMADGLNQALTVDDVEKTEPRDIDFGTNGFSLGQSSYGDTLDSSSDRRALSADGLGNAFSKFVNRTLDTVESQSTGRATSSGGLSGLADGYSGQSNSLSGESATADSLRSKQADAGHAAGKTALDELKGDLSGEPTSTVPKDASLEWRLLNAGAELGGMALGTGITTLKKTLTPENLAQISMAGAAGGPQAAAGIAAVHFSKAGLELLEPQNASLFVRDGMQALRDSGLGVADISELAITLSTWKSTNEHQGYTSRPMMADGRTALDVTRDWALAAAQDSGADILADEESEDVDDLDDLIGQSGSLDQSDETVTVDRQKLVDSLKQVRAITEDEDTATDTPTESDTETTDSEV